MADHRLDLLILGDRLAVCKLGRSDDVPAWAHLGGFSSVTRTADELSIVCAEAHVPRAVRSEPGWRLLRVAGSMDFSAVGVLASLTSPLARHGIGLFAVSTFDTDYLLVKDADLPRAVDALVASGHAVRDADPGPTP